MRRKASEGTCEGGIVESDWNLDRQDVRGKDGSSYRNVFTLMWSA